MKSSWVTYMADSNIGKDWTLGNLLSITLYILYIIKPHLGLNSNKGMIANFSKYAHEKLY